MRLSLLFILLFSTQAFAIEICEVGDTRILEALVLESEQGYFKTVNAERSTTFKERQMIHTAVTLQDHLRGFSKEESLVEFFGAEGSIRYFKDQTRNYAIVSYYPGDNEHGAIFTVSEKMGTSFRKVAGIYDGDIACDILE